MNFSLAMLAPIEWGALIASAWLAVKAYWAPRLTGFKGRLFASAATAIVVLVLTPAVFAVLTEIGDYPTGTCPNCSLLNKAAIWPALLFVVLLIMMPTVLLIYLVTLKKPDASLKLE